MIYEDFRIIIFKYKKITNLDVFDRIPMQVHDVEDL